MITVAVKLFIEYEKELDNSDKKIKRYEVYIGDNKIRNNILDKVCGENVKEICSEKDDDCRRISINRFLKILNNNKLEMVSNKYLLWKKVSIIFY